MIRTLLLIIINFIRIIYNKIRFNRRFKVHYIQRISPFCRLKLYDKGNIIIKQNCEFAHGCNFEVHNKATLIIGNNTYFNRDCIISTHKSIKIGNNCMFGPGVRIFDNNHRFSKDKGVLSTLNCKEISIGNNCWIASNVIILKGSHIGDNCIIGAGCIIQGNIPSGNIVRLKQNIEIEKIR